MMMVGLTVKRTPITTAVLMPEKKIQTFSMSKLCPVYHYYCYRIGRLRIKKTMYSSKIGNKKLMKATNRLLFLIAAFLYFATFASAEDTYRFERMWPSPPHQWFFDDPRAITIDKNNNVYVVESKHNLIIKFAYEGQLISKWGTSGTGAGQLNEPNGIATDSAGNVYVADTLNHRIQKFTSDGTYITDWGGSGASDGKFSNPHGIAVDSTGNVYVADTGNDRIQKFDSSGAFLTKWGNYGSGNGQFDSPIGVDVDGDKKVYVVDSKNYRVQKFSSNGAYIAEWGSYGTGNGEFSEPWGIAADSNGYIYVDDISSNLIQKFSSDGQFVAKWNTEYLDGAFNIPEAKGFSVDSNGYVFAGDIENHCIYKFSSDGTHILTWKSWSHEDGEFHNPTGIAVDNENGYVYVADWGNLRIQKFTTEGVFIKKWGSYYAYPGIFGPFAIELDQEGILYVVSNDGHCIYKFTSEGEYITHWGSYGTGEGEFNHPHGITIDNSGYIYVTDSYNHRVQKFSSDGGFIKEWGSNGSGDGQFFQPSGIAADQSGNIYVADNNQRIQVFSSDGAFITKWGEYGNEDGQLNFPEGIQVDKDGNLYICDGRNHRIQKFTSDGTFILKVGEYGFSPGQFNRPMRLDISDNGAIYVADIGNNRVQVFSQSPVQPEVSKAIIVAGGGPFAGNNIWDITEMSANFAYRALEYQGYTKETIYYISSDTDLDLGGNGILDDVDADATNSNLEYAIKTWAQDATDLVIYLVDHGGDGTFRMSGTEILHAATLDEWLDTQQGGSNGSIVFIYDACSSGSFLSYLGSPSVPLRVVTTSTDIAQEAYFVSGGTLSFGYLFWSHIFNGDSFYDAFLHAKNSIEYTYPQNPRLDADGDGIGNEKEDKDIAATVQIGNETVTGGDIPTIGEVSSPQVLNGEKVALIYADNVIDANGINRVWVVITPPNYSSSSPDIPVANLPILDLSPVGEGRYEGTYSGFTKKGDYNIAVYASDTKGLISLPVSTTVTQQKGTVMTLAGPYLLLFY
jgi:DNA-binding beta-propeller fold protein YncE